MSESKRPSLIVIVGGGFLLVCLALVAWGALTGQVELTEPPVVTQAEFLQIQNGMSYEEVQRIIGAPGQEMSRSDVAGINTVMYQWINRGGSNMNAMFQNGKLVQKAQFGLQ
jgi:hypothetical protein